MVCLSESSRSFNEILIKESQEVAELPCEHPLANTKINHNFVDQRRRVSECERILASTCADVTPESSETKRSSLYQGLWRWAEKRFKGAVRHQVNMKIFHPGDVAPPSKYPRRRLCPDSPGCNLSHRGHLLRRNARALFTHCFQGFPQWRMSVHHPTPGRRSWLGQSRCWRPKRWFEWCCWHRRGRRSERWRGTYQVNQTREALWSMGTALETRDPSRGEWHTYRQLPSTPLHWHRAQITTTAKATCWSHRRGMAGLLTDGLN